MRARPSKYGNVRSPYGGRMFASKREAFHAQVLDALKHAKEPVQRVRTILYQHRMPIVVNGAKICVYVADFYVTFEDGHKEIHETKGFRTREYILKKKLVEAIYGEKIIEF